MSKPRRTLAEMASASNQVAGGTVCCPRCSCQDFRTYKTDRKQASVFRYKSCRHCGHKILTTTVSQERLIRDIDEADMEDEGEIEFQPVRRFPA
jgi:transposase-like protein